MKNYCLTGLAALTVAAAFSSCSTVSHEATTVAVESKIVSTTVGEMNVSKQKASSTVNWNWSPFNAVRPSEIQQQAAAQLLRENNADVIVEPVYEIQRRGLFRGGTVTVSGYPATYTNFRPLRENEELMLNKNRVCPTTETQIMRPGSFLGSKKASKPKGEKKTYRNNSFLNITIGPNFLSTPDRYNPDDTEDYTTTSLGLLYGHYCVNRWGWYVRANLEFGAGLNYNHYTYGDRGYGYNHQNNERCTSMHRKHAATVGAGALFAFSNKVGVFAGAGLGAQICDYLPAEYSILYYGCENSDGYGKAEFALPLEIGFDFRFGAFNAMVGYRYTALPSVDSEHMSSLVLGVGFNF